MKKTKYMGRSVAYQVGVHFKPRVEFAGKITQNAACGNYPRHTVNAEGRCVSLVASKKPSVIHAVTRHGLANERKHV